MPIRPAQFLEKNQKEKMKEIKDWISEHKLSQGSATNQWNNNPFEDKP